MNVNGGEQMPGEAAATRKKEKALRFVWIKSLCHKITDLSEQERGVVTPAEANPVWT